MSEGSKLGFASIIRHSSVRLALRSSVRIECRIGAPGLGPNLVLVPVNLSESGVRLVLHLDLPEGQEVEIIFQGPGQPVKRVGKVAWSSTRPDGAFETGIHFDSDLTQADYHNFTESQCSSG